MKNLILSLIIFATFSPNLSHAVYDYAQKKQEKKDASRWSLSEWLNQKSKIKWSDSWLAYNYTEPYEFYLGVDTSTFDLNIENAVTTLPVENFRSIRGEFAGYVSIVGLKGVYENIDNNTNEWQALFMFRLMGSSDQSTNLTIHYGLRGWDRNGENVQNQVGGGQVTLYLFKRFGIYGDYTYIIEAESNLANKVSGYNWYAGAFMDFSILRLYGHYYEERQKFEQTTAYTYEDRNGVQFGLRLYF